MTPRNAKQRASGSKARTDRSETVQSQREQRRLARQPQPFSTKPRVLTAAEIVQARELRATYDVLASRAMSLSYDALGDTWRAAQEAYQTNPTDETFAAMKKAALEKSFFRADTRSRTRCKPAMGMFLAKNVVPWALQIIERNLTAAADALRKVRAVENRRCIKLTGRPLTQSDIVSVAERPVRRLEAMKSRLLTPAVPTLLPSIDRLMKMFDSIGSERFEDLIAPEFTPEQIAAAVEEEEKARAEETETSVLDEGEFPAPPAESPEPPSL